MVSPARSARNEPLGNGTRLGICLQIDVEVGTLVERCLLHRALNHVGHAEERAAIVAEGRIDDLVGRVQYARHIAPLVDGFVGQSEAFELVSVGLEELQALLFDQIKPLTLEM